MFFLSKEEIIISNGNTIQVININTKERIIKEGSENLGIGCIAVDPSRKYIAVAECGKYPNIYIYEYPGFRLFRILRKGTDNAFTALNFNVNGNILASVGSDPDFSLVIWNWKKESIILKSKAFAQDVFSVTFSDNFEEKLITSGIGHIKYINKYNSQILANG